MFSSKNLSRKKGVKSPKKDQNLQSSRVRVYRGFFVCVWEWENHECDQVRRQEASQGQEVLVRLFPNCLGCGSPGAHDVATEARLVQGEISNPQRKRRPEGIIETGPVALGGQT
ncbi:hypothetical protein RHMOL_Rhmol03G0135200 [Rhododendron molle]|uniref:Uncharacterized protein n=1 Tax=Rhododendron molle TaxID=49168 RepID=A0ACC0PDJ0_RHOML|nr:hypothetical protein RHMOL_Rhmol03G0135200 [Rhododendron molle]